MPGVAPVAEAASPKRERQNDDNRNWPRVRGANLLCS